MESPLQFEQLPTEVLVDILASICDIHCLWSLLLASPASHRVFNRYSEEIFWPAISDSIVPSQTQEVVSFILLLRAGAFRTTKLDDIIRKIKDREAGIVLGKSEELGYDFPTADTSKRPSLGDKRRILSLAAQVHCLSRSCIDHCLNQLAVARAEKRADWTGADDQIRRPSWVEEQRVVRAVWRIQLVFELKRAARSGLVLCARDDAADELNIQDFYDSSTSNLKAAHHEVMTAAEYLDHVHGTARPAASREGLPAPTWPLYNFSPSSLRMPTTGALRRSSMVLPTDGLWIVDSMSRGAHSPIKFAGFGPYRALGFAIWDRHRLADMGLASPPGQGRVTGLGSYFSYWLRLLSADDVVKAEEAMREVESQGGRLGPLQPMIQDNES
ncbi:hypothetical protein C8035_v009168 [Colletotrichum spinosum]|uniref:F-box domain-containing protein n=1 Tax=Colletotrichum spinosum TaxID=1347390 RepID=A0A4R8QH84_9PEZI|nr:hypothetical protein C8035_v009168 [Colletotrichum spinosum]